MGTLTEDTQIRLPESVGADMQDFIGRMQELDEAEQVSIGKSIDMKTFSLKTATERLRLVYNCDIKKR